jgi:hypothetical protein
MMHAEVWHEPPAKFMDQLSGGAVDVWNVPVVQKLQFIGVSALLIDIGETLRRSKSQVNELVPRGHKEFAILNPVRFGFAWVPSARPRRSIHSISCVSRTRH